MKADWRFIVIAEYFLAPWTFVPNILLSQIFLYCCLWQASHRSGVETKGASEAAPFVALAVQWNVLDGPRVAVQNLFCRKPVNFLVSVIIDVGIPDVHRTHVRVLN